MSSSLRNDMTLLTRTLVILLWLSALVACTDAFSGNKCPVTEPVWEKPPEDAAVLNPPAYGYYFSNEDQSIWASAGWATSKDNPLHVTDEGIKVGWFRPAGALLEITGRRLDGKATALVAEAPCCYPTRFQASGLYFPTEGCWEVIARSDNKELRFVVWVEPRVE